MIKRIYYTLISLFKHSTYWRAIITCPYAEPLHRHHDGCPACFLEEIKEVT